MLSFSLILSLRIWGLLRDGRPHAFLCSSSLKRDAEHFLGIRHNLHELLCMFMLSITSPFFFLSVLCSIFLLPPLPSPCNKSQPFHNPLGAVHNYPSSNCRSIYIRQCRGLPSLMEVCVSTECIFRDLTARVQVLLALIDVRLSLSGLAWVCSIKRAFANSGQRRAQQQVAHLLRREKAAIHLRTVLLRDPTLRCERETCQGRRTHSSS